MAAQIFATVVDRAFDETLLVAGVVNIDGDYSDTFALPAGFGDCALLEAYVAVTSIATILASATEYGPTVTMVSPAGAVQDLPFQDNWVRRLTDGVGCRLGPDQVQFWREHDLLQLNFEEIDTNATAAADLGFYVKVRRLRPELNRSAEERQFFLTS